MTADDDAEEDIGDTDAKMPGHFGASAPRTSLGAGPGELPPFTRGASIFRIGFAGRGRGRGM
jgi:hypothetical protein